MSVSTSWIGSDCSRFFSLSRARRRSFSGMAQACGEQKLREEVALAYRAAALLGWDMVIFNHITARIPGTEYFLINAFGTRFKDVTASSLLTVDLDGNVIDAGNGSGPLFLNGFVVHSSVHRARHDVEVAVHTHQKAVSSVSMTKDGLLPLSQESYICMGAGISYHKFEGPAIDTSEIDRIGARLGPTNKILMLENHGPVCCGTDMAEAIYLTWFLERACQYQIDALAAVGGDLDRLHLPTEEEFAEIVSRDQHASGDYDQKSLFWQAIIADVEEKWGMGYTE
jgi:adducin